MPRRLPSSSNRPKAAPARNARRRTTSAVFSSTTAYCYRPAHSLREPSSGEPETRAGGWVLVRKRRPTSLQAGVCQQAALVGKDEGASGWDTSARRGVVTDQPGLPAETQ